MKHFLLYFCSALLLSVSSFAQVSLGPAGGVYVTHYRFSPRSLASSSKDDKIVVNCKLGGLANISLSSKWQLQPCIFFSVNGFKNVKPNNPNSTNKSRIYAVELPLYIKHKFSKAENHFFITAGPSLIVNIKSTADIALYDVAGNYVGTTKYDMPIGKSTTGIRRFGMGAGASFGYEINNRLSFQVFYQRTLVNIYPEIYHVKLSYENYGAICAYQFQLKKGKKAK